MGLVQGKSGRPAMVLVQALLAGPAQWVWRRASRGVLLWYWCRHSWQDLHHGSGAGQVGVSCYGIGAGTPGRTCTMGLVQGKSRCPATIQVQALLEGPAPDPGAGQVGASCYGIGAGTPGRTCTMGLAQDKSGRPAIVKVQALLEGSAIWV